MPIVAANFCSSLLGSSERNSNSNHLLRKASLLITFLVLAGCHPAKPPAPVEPESPNPADQFEVINFSSTPSGASVKLSSGESCVAPCKVRKSLDSQFSATFQKEGYRTATVEVMNNLEALKKFNRSRGAKTDGLRVSTLRMTPNPVSVTLEPQWSK